MIKAIENSSYRISKVITFNGNCDIYCIESTHTSNCLFIEKKDLKKLEETIQLLIKVKDIF